MSTSPTGFPKIRATITLDMEPANVIDMNTLWLKMGVAPVGSLSQAIPDQNVTRIVFENPITLSIVGRTLLFSSEPVFVTAIGADALTATVERWQDAFPFMQYLPQVRRQPHLALWRMVA